MSERDFTDATVVFVLRDDPATGRTQVLLGRKSPTASYGAGKWAPPGGKRILHETYENCVVRETAEEVGITLDPAQLTHTANLWSFMDGVPLFHVRVYVTRAYEGEPTASAEMTPAWHDVAELPFGQMFDGDRAWVPGVLRGERWNIWAYQKSDANETWQLHRVPWNN